MEWDRQNGDVTESRAFLSGDSEMHRLVRGYDWASTSLGPIGAWPQSLKTATALLLNSPVPIVMLWGEDGHMLYNDAYSVFAGGRHPQLLGSKVREGWPEVADFNDNVMKVGLAGRTLSYQDQELTLYRKGVPEQVWMNLDYSPVLDEAGEPAGVICILRETTERVAFEAALRESEARFRNVADHAPVIMWVTDPDAHCTYLNRAWYEFTGQTPEEAEGFGWLDATHPDDKAEAERVFLEANAERKPFRLEYRLRRHDGAYRWAIDAASPRFGQQGEFLGYVGSVIDIDERREMEERLRASEARHRTLFESIESGFCIVEVDLDASGGRVDYRVVEANPAFYRQTGFPATIFDRWLREASPDLEEHWYDTYGRVARTGEPYRFEQGSDMLGRWFDVYAFPTGAPEERRVAILFNDISARRNAENALRDLNDTLEIRVGERTAELERAHDQLRQSQKLEAMGALTGGVAHDFNNLLTPIFGSLDMLQRKGVGGEREQRMIAGAIQSAERAKTLVQRLLAFARRQPLQAIPVDVGHLVENMAALVASTTGPQIRVVVEAAGDLPSAIADPNQVEMALLNLAVNARDAMPDGGTLRISAATEMVKRGHRADLKAGEYVVLSVADTGIGMDELTLKRAVEPFFSTKGIGKGTGLGLSMVHGLASQLGGALAIQSKPGLGTNIELWLPVSSAPPAATGEAPGAQPEPARAGTALLVDDEELVRTSTANMLSDLGYAVVEAESAEQALELFHGGLRPTVLVTDHLMPGMNGTDLARTLRSEQPGLPVLVVSGYAESEGIAPDLPRLTKPFRNEELAAGLAGAQAKER